MYIDLVPAIGGEGLCEHPTIPQGLKPALFLGLCGTVENQGRRGEYWFVHSLVPKGEGPGAPSIRVFIHLGGP